MEVISKCGLRAVRRSLHRMVRRLCELLVKSELVILPIVGLNATIVDQVVNRPVDRVTDWGTTAKATRWIGEAPTPSGRRGTQRILKRLAAR